LEVEFKRESGLKPAEGFDLGPELMSLAADAVFVMVEVEVAVAE